MSKSLSDILLERLENKSDISLRSHKNREDILEVLTKNVALQREIIAGYTHLLKLQEETVKELGSGLGHLMEDEDVLHQIGNTLLNDATMLKNFFVYMTRHKPTILEFLNDVELPIMEEVLGDELDFERLTLISAIVEKAINERTNKKD